MAHPLFDTHAHLISDDWVTYPPKPWRADLPTPPRTDYSVTADALIRMMDDHDVPTACVVQRGHLYGYDNRYILEAARQYPGRLLPIVILDPHDPQTAGRFTGMVKHEGVRGFRMAAIRPGNLDTAWMSSPSAMQIWQACADLNAPMTLIFFYHHLSYTLPLLHVIAKKYPALPILIDHLGTAYGVSVPERRWAKEEGFGEVPTPPPPDFGDRGDDPDLRGRAQRLLQAHRDQHGMPASRRHRSRPHRASDGRQLPELNVWCGDLTLGRACAGLTPTKPPWPVTRPAS